MENCHGDPEAEPEAGIVMKKKQKRRRKRRSGLREDDLKLLNDLTDFPYLAAMLQAQAVLGGPHNIEKMGQSENHAPEIGTPPQAGGKEQQNKSGLLETIASMRRWVKEKMENCSGNDKEPKANSRKKKRRRKILPDDELKLLNDLSGFPHLATIFRADTVIGARKALERQKMNGHAMNSTEMGCQPQAISDLKTEEQQEQSKSSESGTHVPEKKIDTMENGNGDNEEQRSGKMKKMQGNRFPDDELKMLNDMRGFPHAAIIFQAGQAIGEIKPARSEKADSPETTNSTDDGSQSPNIVDASRGDCGAETYELVQMDKDADTLEVIDCPSSSTEQEGDSVTEEQQEKSSSYECSLKTEALLPLAEDILPVKLLAAAGDGDACKEVSRSKENSVLRKLLRRWRYFNSEDGFYLDGRGVKTVAKNRRKRCYVCGDVQHTGNKCRKRCTCYICNERGHLAEDCPKSSHEFNFCLRCGESGHDLFSCNNDYPPDDLKNIVCYVCNEVGHICCHSYANIRPDTISCYNCGESGHWGLQCPKPHMDKKSPRPPSICYKCGEEGHAARKCVHVQNKCQQSKDYSTESNVVPMV